MRTAGGLGMKAPIERISVFCQAADTQIKIFHHCQGSVIGGFFNQGVSWPAVCTINKGVQIATVFRIKKLSKAVDADI